MKRWYITFLAVICSVNFLYGQITIDSQFLNNNIKVFFINDLNLTQSSSSPLLFQVIVTNTTTVDREISLHLSIMYDGLASGATELAHGNTERFLLFASQSLVINNQNLFSQADQYRLQEYSINEDAANELIDIILSTGKLPTGRYEFLITITDYTDGGNEYIDPDPIIIEISNPTSLDLISPGEPAGSAEIMEIYTTLPLFHWESDASQFRLKVCEKLATNTSPEDVMSNEPRLETTITGTTYFQYPSAGAFPLEEGKTYFWQVVAITPSSSGPIEMESEIWGFKVANLSAGQSRLLLMQYKNTLNMLLGGDLIEGLFDESGELANYYPTGVVLINGVSVSQEKLNALIEKILSGKAKIKGYTIE